MYVIEAGIESPDQIEFDGLQDVEWHVFDPLLPTRPVPTTDQIVGAKEKGLELRLLSPISDHLLVVQTFTPHIPPPKGLFSESSQSHNELILLVRHPLVLEKVGEVVLGFAEPPPL